MSRQISEERQTAYYAGMGMMIVGGLMFFSTFVTFAMHFGDFSNFESNAKSEMYRAFGGMALLVLGRIVMGIGARGLAGSGVILDPEQARQDVEPYSRMAGGMLKDVLDEAQIKIGSAESQKAEAQKIVVLKCLSCETLNQEDAKFCKQCGKKF